MDIILIHSKGRPALSPNGFTRRTTYCQTTTEDIRYGKQPISANYSSKIVLGNVIRLFIAQRKGWDILENKKWFKFKR